MSNKYNTGSLAYQLDQERYNELSDDLYELKRLSKKTHSRIVKKQLAKIMLLVIWGMHETETE